MLRYLLLHIVLQPLCLFKIFTEASGKVKNGLCGMIMRSAVFLLKVRCLGRTVTDVVGNRGP